MGKRKNRLRERGGEEKDSLKEREKEREREIGRVRIVAICVNPYTL